MTFNSLDRNRIGIVTLLIAVLATTGCVPTKTASTYSRSDMGRIATVMKGQIIAIREVDISGNTAIGSAAGAGIGATAGSTAGGSGEDHIVGAIAGAVAGGIIGAAVEEGATKGSAFEFIIQQKNGQTIAIVQTNEDNLQVGEKVLILRSGKARVIRDQGIE